MEPVSINSQDQSDLLVDQSRTIINLSLSVKAYMRRVIELEAENAELTSKIPEGE